MRFTQTDYPLTTEQTVACFQAENKVEFIVDVSLHDLISCYSIDDINNICDETIFGDNSEVSACIVDIAYEVEGATNKDTVALRVFAEVEEI
jgi:hypothetical protein